MKTDRVLALFVLAHNNSEVFNALLFTQKKVDTAKDRVLRAGFVFNKDNIVIAHGEMSAEGLAKVDNAIGGIMYLHNVSPLWEGYRPVQTLDEKLRLIAEFDIALNEAIIDSTH